MDFKIAVVGLGLMGASLAWSLKGFRQSEIVGVDIDEDVCRKAVQQGAVDKAYTDPAEALENADLIIYCVYAHNIPYLIEKNKAYIKSGAIIADICGVKTSLYASLSKIIPDHVDYVGLHPMTGKERDGFDNADPAIYQNSSFIICPWPRTKETTVALAKDLALHIGVDPKRLTICSIDLHDQVIAYTSDLMHISAAALCLDYHPQMNSSFTAGAFRDCTRVGDINAEAWTELLLDNRVNTANCLKAYMSNLNKMLQALETNNSKMMFQLLQSAGDKKRKMLEL